MPARYRSLESSSSRTSFCSQRERLLRRLRVEHLDRDAEVDEHVITLPRLGHEREWDDLAAAQSARARVSVLPGLLEDIDRAEAHQSGSSSSTLSSTTPCAFASV